MKSADAIVIPLVRKHDILKSFPHPLTWTLTPNGDVDIPDLVDANQPGSQIVKPETRFNEIRTLIHILDS